MSGSLFLAETQAFLKALASETRQQIMQEFATGAALTVGEIAARCGIGQSTASEQLTILRQGGLVTSTRAGKQVLFVSIDGSCAGVRSVVDGTIGATVMQFPANMGKLAVDAIDKAVKTGEKPNGINNSGTVLITDQPVDGIESKDTKWGLANCWGE